MNNGFGHGNSFQRNSSDNLDYIIEVGQGEYVLLLFFYILLLFLPIESFYSGFCKAYYVP